MSWEVALWLRFLTYGICTNTHFLKIYLDTGANVPEANKYDVILKGRQGTGMVKMPWFSRLVDTVLFPLLFFGGQFGFG